MTKRATILLADDDAAVRQMLAAALENDVDVLHAADGAAAVEAIILQRPHLVVLDDMMPGLTGMQIAEMMQKQRVAAGIVMLTGSTAVRDAMRASMAGVIDYITKPFNPAITAARILQIADNRQWRVRVQHDNALVQALLADALHRSGIQIDDTADRVIGPDIATPFCPLDVVAHTIRALARGDIYV